MKSILIVDDNPLNRDLASAMLSRSGFATRKAASGKEALAMLDEASVDVVVTDIGMPGMNGIELCAIIRRRLGPHAPRLVAFTAFGMNDERSSIMAAGFDAIVIKPATRALLTAAIEPLPAPAGRPS